MVGITYLDDREIKILNDLLKKIFGEYTTTTKCEPIIRKVNEIVEQKTRQISAVVDSIKK